MKIQVLKIAIAACTILLVENCQKNEENAVNPVHNLSEDHSEPPKIPNGGSATEDCNVYKWTKNTVTWKLVDPYPNFDVASQRASIKKAFDSWSTYIPLTFVEVTKEADIEIRFVCGSWMDRDLSGAIYEKTFERGSNSIGWGFYPPSICVSNQRERLLAEGNIFFSSCLDYDQMGASKAYPFQVLAVHEIGHALGLPHNSSTNSVMYESAITNVLSVEDIKNIQTIYGYRDNAPTPVPTTPTQPVPVPTPVPTPQSQMYITPSVGSKSNDYYIDKNSNSNSCGLLFFNGVNFEVLSLSGNTVTIRVNKYSTGSFQQKGTMYIKTGGTCGIPSYTHSYLAGGSFDYSFTIYKGQNLTITITSDTGDRFNLGEITAY